MGDPNSRHDPIRKIGLAGRVFTSFFGIIFALVGLSVIVFLWSRPSGGFGSPPVFFRVFGSLIGLAFIGFGVMSAFGALSMGKVMDHARRAAAKARRTGAKCPNCGAAVANRIAGPDSNDVECTFCGSVFRASDATRPGGR